MNTLSTAAKFLCSIAQRFRIRRVGVIRVSRWVLAQRFVVAGFMLMTLAQNASAHAWEKLASLPVPNGGFISGEVQGMVVVLGGTNWEGDKKNWLNVVYQFDPTTLAWTTLDSMPSPLAYGIGANLNGVFSVIAGTTGVSPWHGVVRVKGGRVRATTDGGVSSPAVLSAGGLIDEEFIIVGGTDDAANIRNLHRGALALNVATGRTRTLPEYPGSGIGAAASAVAAGELFVFAGANWDPSSRRVKNVAESWAFSPSRGEWRPLRPYPLAARGVAAVALDQGRIYLVGGYLADDFTDRAYVYDTITGLYTPALALPYKGQVGLVRCGEYIYCLGGEDRMKHRSDAVHRVKVTEIID